jgi:hypothetical protein
VLCVLRCYSPMQADRIPTSGMRATVITSDAEWCKRQRGQDYATEASSAGYAA